MGVASTAPVRPARVRAIAVRGVVGLLVGTILVVAFVRLLNVSAVIHRLTHLRIGFALLCGVAFLGAYVVRAVRWRYLLAPCRVSVGRAVAIYQVAIFINWMMPVRGGELAKSLLLRRLNAIPVSRSLATVTMDKAMDLLPAVALLVALPFVALNLSRALWALLLWALAAVVLACAVLGLAAWRRDRTVALVLAGLDRVLPRRARARVEAFLVPFIDTLLALFRRPRMLLVAAAYTAVAVSLDATFCLLAFKAVGTAIPVSVVLYGYTFYNLAYILPTPPGQVGSNELMGLLIFSGAFGINRSGVGAMFLFSHPWTAILMTASGLLCLSAMGLTLRGALRLSGDAAESQQP